MAASCLGRHPADPEAAQLETSWKSAPVSEESVFESRPKKLRHFALWSAAILLVLGVFSGLLVGVSFAIREAYHNEGCKAGTVLLQDPAKPSAGEPKEVSPWEAAAETMKAALDAAVGNFSSATAGINAHITTEALHDAQAWEAYMMYRTMYGSAEALSFSAHRDVVSSIKQDIAVMDKAMLEENNVPDAATHLVKVIAGADRLASDVNTKPFGVIAAGNDPSVTFKSIVLSALTSLTEYTQNVVARGGVTISSALVGETVLMDMHGALLAVDTAVSAVAPVLTEAGQMAVLDAAQDATLAALREVQRHSMPVTDFWLTKAAKPETCAQEMVKQITECSAKIAALKSGSGCTPGADCEQKVRDQEKKCDDEEAEKALKCTDRRAFIRECGVKYENVLRNCSAAVARGGVSEEQWACKESADRARVMCIQEAEYMRKCDEDRDKVLKGCTDPQSASCQASALAKRQSCMQLESGKRMICKYAKRDEHIRKCSNSDASRLQLCAAYMGGATQQYRSCMDSANTAAGACKFNIEREVKKCDEEIPCKNKEDAEKAKCTDAYTRAVDACGSDTDCAANAAEQKNTCEEKAKADGKTCRDGSALNAVNKWVSEQEAKGEIVSSVMRYNHFLPVSVLTQQQRNNVNAQLTKLADAMDDLRAAWAANAARVDG